MSCFFDSRGISDIFIITCAEGKSLFHLCVVVYLLDYSKSYERILVNFLDGWAVVLGTVV